MNVAKGCPYHFGFHAAVDVVTWLVQGKEREYLQMMVQGSLYDQSAITAIDLEEYGWWYAAPGGVRGALSIIERFWVMPHPIKSRQNKG